VTIDPDIDWVAGGITLGVIALIVIAIWVGCLRGDLRDEEADRKEARELVNALVTLEPAFLEALGRKPHYRDWQPYDRWEGARVLDIERVIRLAKTRRTLDKHARQDAELTTALADLARARKDSK
jgi:hypothetical protein